MKKNYFSPLNCLACDGYAYTCKAYTAIYQETCSWYETVENDLQKMIEGKGMLTFPSIADLIKQNDDRT